MPAPYVQGRCPWCRLPALVAAFLLLAGCQTTGPGETSGTAHRASQNARKNPQLPVGNVAALRPGDSVIVHFQSVPDPAEFSVQIDDQGMISLRYLGRLSAAGLTASQLAERIRTACIEGKIYLQVDVSVKLTERFIYVGGEVKRPGPVLWTNDLTLTRAISAAGGFTLYAKETAVKLNRESNNYSVDAALATRQPAEDVTLMPGDVLFVDKSAF